MTGRPSWAADVPPTRSAGATAAAERPPATLVAAAAGTVALAVAEAAAVLGRDELRPALRTVLVAGIALQLPAAGFALRRSPAAAMLLLLCALSAAVAFLARGQLPVAAGAGAVLVLLGLSLRWFPGSEPWAP